MTNIEIHHNAGRYKIIAKGHAEYNPGNDIVCAALSCLMQTLALAIDNTQGITYLESDFQSGDAFVSFFYDHISAKNVIDTIEAGLKSLARTYPNHINLAYI